MDIPALDDSLRWLATGLGTDTLVLNPLLAVILLALTCGAVGSTVVGNRMAFFSDAMAHTAFAGVAVALLSIILLAGVSNRREADAYSDVVLLVMIGVGAASGCLMVFVRERTGLTNDTVIGVFFALALGLGAMVLPPVKERVGIDLDTFLYGQISLVRGGELAALALALVASWAVLAWRYNQFALASFNPSLAQSRGVPVRGNQYLFVVLLALVVNVAINSVGILLINALLVVPAAAAANLARSLRGVFWWTLALTLFSGVAGLEVHRHFAIPLGGGRRMALFPSGTIVVVSVLLFALSLAVRAVRPARRESPAPAVAVAARP